jgi:aryl-alcohol dehydrogenase-like predicted oxidoreductase
MKYRECKASGLRLPVLGIGCWSFGGGAYWGKQSQKDVDAVVNAALDAGCTYFDTAEVYNNGDSESALGKALKGRRHEAIVGSKILPSNCQPQSLKQHCEASLTRLGMDYIDLYMIHWPIHSQAVASFTSDDSLIKNPPRLDAAVKTLQELQKEGKIRHIGISNFGVVQMEEILELGATIAVNQLPYNLLFQTIEAEVLPYCKEKGIGVIGYMGLMQGLLAGKYKDADSVPPNRARVRHFRGDRPGSRHGEAGAEKETFEALAKISLIGAELGVPMHLLAIAWSMAHPDLTCTLIGARNQDQLSDNIKALGVELDEEVMSALDDATELLMKKVGTSLDLFEHTDRSRSW